ncbi:Bug family tripartite tricarboxylate transporter substrate binding protein [Roseomonas populi]|uniref:Tripartite tricarboxylate transporter substrate binding protein n=1 Tax=Roseomonas populi TaxID=3121582 RepID=A0ABT1XD65_9PROT|nr:tripartite tricarboxylate transporter substrate binding protein [Roseomonas pecuniae]MCR0985383.1 tripartite tricarboxylate transporter substrate binding protein [Roseomonas pecuniae]
MTLSRRTLGGSLLSGALLPVAGRGARAAETFAATRPVRLLLAFGTGTGADVLARELGQRLGAVVGQPVVVENVTGGTGVVALRTLARAAPDGHTLFLAALGNVVINPMVSAAARGTDALARPVGQMSDNPHVMLIHGALPVKDVREFVAYAKARPGEINFASPGAGGVSHLGAELFQSVAGIQGVHVPYRDGSQLLTDMMTGRVQAGFMSAGGLMPILADGKIRALGVTAPTRVPELQSLPVVESQGLTGFRYSTWYGLYAPAATPDGLIGPLNAALRAALDDEGLRTRLTAQGAELRTGSAGDLAALMEADARTWRAIIQSRGIMAE